MSNILWKNFYLCFSKFKCLPTNLTSPSSSHLDYDHQIPSTIHHLPSTSTLLKSFNSLYEVTSHEYSTTSTTGDFFSSSEEADSDTDSGPAPDFATVYASHRFFFSSPGCSNSIIDSPDTPPETESGSVAGGVAVQTYSPDPYSDFRRSMQEMVEAREVTDVRADWEFLHELLFCYLRLNPKSTHKFIVRAFSDLIVSLIAPTDGGGCRQIEGSHRRASSRQFV